MQRHIFLTLLLGFARESLAQDNNNDDDDASNVNPALTILSCDALPCAQNDNSNNTICSNELAQQQGNNGIGLVPQALNLSSSTDLSLALIDGPPLGTYANAQANYGSSDSTRTDFTTRTLYIGARSSTDLSNAPRGCALMMQHQASTFPYASSSTANPNSTTCPQEFLFDNTAPSDIASYISDFEFGNSSSNLNRCEALAQYVEYRIHNDDIALGAYYSALITVAGGTTSGPDFDSSAHKNVGDLPTLDSDNCQDGSNHQLYNVTSMTQVLTGDSTDSNSTYGGRTGYTPVVSVLYGGDDDDDSDPEVQILCMHIRQADGAELPYSEIYESSANSGPLGLYSSMVGLLAFSASMWVVL